MIWQTRHQPRKTKAHKPASVSSLSEHRAANAETYPGFEGKVLVFDEAVALGPAELVELVNIQTESNRHG